MENMKQKSYPSVGQSWGIVGIAILAQLILAPVYTGVTSSMDKDLALLFYYVLTIGGAFAYAHYIRKKETGIDNYPVSKGSLKLILLVSIFTIVMAIGVTNPIASLIPMPDFFREAFEQMMGEKSIFSFLTIAVAAPILEELIFRGVILDGLLKKYTPQRAIFISSFLFAFLHLNPWQFVAAMAIGAFSGYIYYKTNNLLFCVIIHFANNGFAFILSLFEGGEEQIDMSLIEAYGGVTNAILVIGGCIIVGLVCLGFIKKELNSSVKEEEKELV
ncbi:CPBP family intramembrane glutamic endopeptidase [Plebeiibacterium sediminum]|uniref:CPBP family intramembrane metalloprotease n=1 Tax=Plebeiibacterium sediminum TaxID=2992112 RepID=A0AAE3M5A4_9BACT|nr:type II CAAX endopeptidase family protein [Plebeiobacterium sediminum]MCW3787206.1 CPBP family intramembrane metalloprotease [Plebeiobacterium sediminum]